VLKGQKLQGTITARDAYKLICSRNLLNEFPLIKTIYEIAYEGKPVESIIEGIHVVSSSSSSSRRTPQAQGHQQQQQYQRQAHGHLDLHDRASTFPPRYQQPPPPPTHSSHL
jgi:hypothetical protein